MEIGSAVLELFHAYRQTDWTKLIGAFSQYRLRTRQKFYLKYSSFCRSLDCAARGSRTTRPPATPLCVLQKLAT
jgi:hypothetical protein